MTTNDENNANFEAAVQAAVTKTNTDQKLDPNSPEYIAAATQLLNDPKPEPTVHQPLPVPGYTAQTSDKLALVTENKQQEESVLRTIDFLKGMAKDDPKAIDQRWLNIAKTHFEEGFMAMNRSIMQPQRIALPGDTAHP